MRLPRQNKALKYFITSLLLIFLLAYQNGEFDWFMSDSSSKESSSTIQQNLSINFSEQAKTHILYGDHSGGGHMFGIGKACKSEFPENWDETKIISSVQKIAANDNLHWEKQDNGYFVTETKHDDIQIRVVLGKEKQKVITAYPVNVKRNPCPPHASNDNYNP